VIDQVFADDDDKVITSRDASDAVAMPLGTLNRIIERVHLLKSPATAAYLAS